MISADTPVFPNNVVDIIAFRCKYLDPEGDLQVKKRPLRDTDDPQCIGVFPALWNPNSQSYETSLVNTSPGPTRPTVNRYSLVIQAFIKDMEEERGLAAHSVLSQMVRAMLYTDEPLRVALASLTTEVLGTRERMASWGIMSQRFLNNELNAEWLYLSSVEMWVETEYY